MLVMGRKRSEPVQEEPDTKDRGPREVFHMSQELHDAFISYCESARPTLQKSPVLRVALEDYLAAKGFWPPQK